MPAPLKFLAGLVRSGGRRLRSVSAWTRFLLGRALYDSRVRFDRSLRLRVPLLCDGEGEVVLGPRITVGYDMSPMLGEGMVRLQARHPGSVITVGAGTTFSNNVQVLAERGVAIGARVLVGDAVLIVDSDFHDLSAAGRHEAPPLAAPVVIEDNVFLGSRVVILKGVTIGKDSVIGAGSVVVRSIPPGVIAAGNPAKVLRPL
jgi:maltose O-acetyltransferase